MEPRTHHVALEHRQARRGDPGHDRVTARSGSMREVSVVVDVATQERLEADEHAGAREARKTLGALGVDRRPRDRRELLERDRWCSEPVEERHVAEALQDGAGPSGGEPPLEAGSDVRGLERQGVERFPLVVTRHTGADLRQPLRRGAQRGGRGSPRRRPTLRAARRRTDGSSRAGGTGCWRSPRNARPTTCPQAPAAVRRRPRSPPSAPTPNASAASRSNPPTHTDSRAKLLLSSR